ncbi:MAG: GNAT family N-acetyltransferase [Anaerolineales bacterium]|nr:GNAT family N-acetyltransferase [Anaerolineales bacterium]
MSVINVRTKEQTDCEWVVDLLNTHWGAVRIVSRGRVHEADTLPGFVAELRGRRVGLLTYHIDGDDCEIVSLNSLVEGQRIGTTLMEAVSDEAKRAGCRRLWLITTNDNLPALRFYQKRNFRLVAVHTDAATEARKLKPEIPHEGVYGIPIRDEIELEMIL